MPHEIRTILSEIKGNRKRNILTLFFFLFWGVLEAQQGFFLRETDNPHYQRYKLDGGMQERKNLQPENPFTSVAFTLPTEADFAGLFCVVDGDTLDIKVAAHQPKDKKGLMSNLLVFSEPQEELQLIGEVHRKKEVVIHFFYAAPLPEKVNGENQRRIGSPCEEPVAVPQSIWRKGLPEPDYTRSFNEVRHLIVHHSASGNNAANYTEEVRNYYLYHTQGNGWSDIGYNYLIAPDGTLYAGRDPGEGEQDNVRGAHFCGQNQQTMGVCLIGDYTQKEASMEALAQLEHLLSWKSLKEQLDPLAAHRHPANPELAVIAGHRNGCATECPGEQVYQQLPALRQAVSENVIACIEGQEAENVWVYFASRQQEVCLAGVEERDIESFGIYNIQGKKVLDSPGKRLESEDFCIRMGQMAPGVYFLQLEYGSQLIRKKILLF